MRKLHEEHQDQEDDDDSMPGSELLDDMLLDDPNEIAKHDQKFLRSELNTISVGDTPYPTVDNIKND